MKKLLNKKVTKMTVGDLKKSLKNVDNDKEIVLGFYMKDKGVHFCYLADILTDIKYDGVLKEKSSGMVELMGYNDEYCTYEVKDESESD